VSLLTSRELFIWNYDEKHQYVIVFLIKIPCNFVQVSVLEVDFKFSHVNRNFQCIIMFSKFERR
jgi:hypothetical protein